MLVFGDHARVREPRAVLRELEAALAAHASMPPGIGRHAALAAAFVEAGELAQGLADAERAAIGRDARGPLGDAAMELVMALAAALAASWDGEPARRERADAAIAGLARAALPERVTMKTAEGHACYALYPEAYLVAARAAPAGPRRVIGIRSIGTGLAAMVAIAHGAPRPVTVRPVGDPFRRELVVDRAVIADWQAERAATFAIVDEGPGLSGSSFGAVADLLEDRGIAPARIECYPSHGGALGPLASDRHRARWGQVRRCVAVDDPVRDRLPGWLAELIGPLDAPLEDLSAGRWRARKFRDPSAWPAAVVHLERRKLLATARGTPWLARFVGLGRHADHALARARRLHAAGFTPAPAGVAHGYLVERWIDARVLDPRAFDRGRLVDHVGRYLGFRARTLGAAPSRGASIEQLYEMVRRNTELSLGGGAAASVGARFAASLPRLATASRPIEIDGRLHAWEWLVAGDRLLKADAIDHHAGHDLVGCQDVAWDLAGAELELALSPDELGRVIAVAGVDVDPELRAFLRIAYLAFQLGRHALAIAPAAAVDPAEPARLHAIVARYEGLLRAAVG